MNDDALTLVSLGLGGLAAYLERFRLTEHGANPWSLEGITNVLRLMWHFEAVRTDLQGKYSSVYRSERINKLVGGVATSDHLRGQAVDVLTSQPLDVAARRLYERALRGELGPVHQVIREPSWIHVGWHSPGITTKPEFITKV